MVKSLYSGVSGLTVHQTRMDVIGNNIANVNSDGFKSSRVTFRDIYYQGYRSATSGRDTFAGNNPSQVGYGVQVGSIDKNMSQSGGRSTGSVFDMMLEGDGFFMTMTFDNVNVNSDKSPSVTRYTRLGKFGIDSYGNIAASNNVFVVGSRNTLDGLLLTGDNSGNALNDVEYIDRNDDGKITASDITYRNTLNLNELMQQAWNAYTDEFGYLYGYDWEGIISGRAAANADAGLQQVDAFAGLKFDIQKLQADGYTYTAATATDPAKLTKDGEDITDLETLKKYVDIQETLKALNATDETTGKAVGAQYRYLVDNTGNRIRKEDGSYPVYSVAGGGGNNNTGNNTTTAVYDNMFENNAPKTGNALTQAKATAGAEGAVIGELKYDSADSINIGIDGRILIGYGGDTKYLARIDLAVFMNPEGLDQAGETQFAESSASGEASLKRPRLDPGVTDTSVVSGKVEMSNVNLADEFSDMIITQRGFQANARIITTSDSMLEELVNLKR
ncbi:MAG: flagellar hook-basal body complex protein [Ruminococcus sp.]|nr:flagellar hook-basal body complex protein [Ruminococcus sp.]MCM1380604.1 flagellar hook-basal body complex protein [Muribaculaceae bacterium]MCM1478110.1 flagellar hook-basal body complex protein [Muribaculaceae bacterium]